MRRRTWLAIVLSIVMAVTYVPMIAFAADEGEAGQPEVTVSEDQEPAVEAAELDDGTQYDDEDGDIDDEDDIDDEGGEFALDKDSISDADFDLEGSEYGYATLLPVGDYGIEDYEWEDEELCFTVPIYDSDDDYVAWQLLLKPYQAGTSTLIVTSETGETFDVNVTVSQEMVDMIRYDRFLNDRDLFHFRFYEDPGEMDWYELKGEFRGYLGLEEYSWSDRYVDFEDADEYFELSREDFVGKFKAIYNGSEYDVIISEEENDDEEYVLTIPELPETNAGDTVELRFSTGNSAYSFSVDVTKKEYCEIDWPVKDRYTWTGKPIKPACATINGWIADKDDYDYWNEITLKKDVDYIVDYEYDNGDDSASVGWGCAKIRSTGDYFFDEDCWFQIIPKGTKLGTLKKAKKAITVKWTAQKNKMSYDRITGYQIQVATNKSFTKNKKTVTVKGYKSTSKKVTKLKKKKKYYIRIRTYYVDDYDEYLFSSWSKYKTCKTK